MTEPLVTLDDLEVHFPVGRRLLGPAPVVRAVDGVSIRIMPGQFYGLVGESGSGKTTLGRAILRAVPIAGGSGAYQDGEVRYDLDRMTPAEVKDFRRRAQLIFQDPYAALSPRMTVRDIIA